MNVFFAQMGPTNFRPLRTHSNALTTIVNVHPRTLLLSITSYGHWIVVEGAGDE
jgi:hypothetical protein